MIRLAILASGGGSNADAILRYFAGHPQIRIVLIACNRKMAGVYQIAENHGVESIHLSRERFQSGDGYLPVFREKQVRGLILAGFLWKLPPTLIQAYTHRILNIHPALLPKFGGQGMYGIHVHQAVLAAHETESGITIHRVDEHYDNGDVVFQTACPVDPHDTPESLGKRILQLEHQHYPPTIENYFSQLPN
ncbi:MAG: phosphoribosylglycinamide formyltransferase [Bacteroidetes bacterium]|nr:phosphoribosylglycinamide formyltransferase [Bacteroidota bacterium]